MSGAILQNMIQTDQGYSIVEEVFARADMERVLEELSSAGLERTKAGARHVLRVPVVRDLAADPRMLRIARELVGPGAEPFRATLFDKSPSANWLVVWHQDTALPLRERFEDASWGPWSKKAGILYAHAPSWALEQVVALRVSLDDSSSRNGPLRVLPNTHSRGVLTDAAIEQLARNATAVECVAGSGGVVAMRPLTVHASSKSLDEQPRRVLHIEYAATVNLGTGIQLTVA
jgi:ectoine hydroxylase-related dioxygenase (phytanoyl-CoA dioxygenase family)